MQEKIAAIRKHTALLREETQQKQQALGQMKIEKEKAAQEQAKKEQEEHLRKEKEEKERL